MLPHPLHIPESTLFAFPYRSLDIAHPNPITGTRPIRRIHSLSFLHLMVYRLMPRTKPLYAFGRWQILILSPTASDKTLIDFGGTHSVRSAASKREKKKPWNRSETVARLQNHWTIRLSPDLQFASMFVS